MSYATLMVHVDRGAGATARVRLARGLADRFDATLIGIAGSPVMIPAVADHVMVLDERVAQDARAEARDAAAETEALFQGAVADGARVEWTAELADPTALVIDRAMRADLVIVGQGDGRIDFPLSVEPGDLLMDLGRPLLVVPRGCDALGADAALVAWKNTREARRAVRDALPLLATVREVVVAAVGREAAEEGAGDVVAYLERHGIKARVRIVTSPQESAGEEILALAAQAGAGFVVAGAYGHSRMREWVFGGVTRTLLREARLPCLLSH